MVVDLKSTGCQSPRGSNPLLSAKIKINANAPPIYIAAAFAFSFPCYLRIVRSTAGLEPQVREPENGVHIEIMVILYIHFEYGKLLVCQKRQIAIQGDGQ